MRTYYLTVEINSVSYDFTIDVSAAYPKKAPVFTYIPDKPPAATDSGEEEETVIPPTPLLLFFNVCACILIA